MRFIAFSMVPLAGQKYALRNISPHHKRVCPPAFAIAEDFTQIIPGFHPSAPCCGPSPTEPTRAIVKLGLHTLASPPGVPLNLRLDTRTQKGDWFTVTFVKLNEGTASDRPGFL